MRIPKFWEVAEGSEIGPRGERLFRRVWGWSTSSSAEAFAVAQERLRTTLANIRSGARPDTYYPRTPLREPTLDERVVDGEVLFAVTRNRYGAEVLNTERVLIADVDLPELDMPAGGLLRRLFRRTPADTDPQAEPAPVVERLAGIAHWASEHPSFGVIVYRTASGLRVFVTGVPDAATSAVGEQILVDLRADPIYRELCRAHGTFRARLTPKPWRLPRMKAPRDRWPYSDADAEQRFDRWLAAYDGAARDFAVCRRLASFGPVPSTVEAAIIQVHDERTRVSASLPLA
jgi:hypothetical protein